MEVEEATISPPDPSIIDEPVIRKYNVPYDIEDNSFVDGVPSEIVTLIQTLMFGK